MKAAEESTFESHLHAKSQQYHDLLGKIGARTSFRILLVLLIGWAPLPVLIVAESMIHRNPSLFTFFSDFGVHTRSLLAAPLLVYSEIICLPRLAVVVEHFISGGLIRENSRARFDAAVASTKVWANSKLV